MRRKVLVSVIVVIGCGLAASYMTSRLIHEHKDQPAEAKVKVLVAKQKISPWVPIKEPEKFFVEKEAPASAAPRRALKSFEEIKDQKLCKVVNEDSIVTTDDLLNKDQASLAHLMKPGQRPTAVKLNAASLAGGSVRPGTHVDVVYTPRCGPETETKTILQNMLVLAVDTKAVRDPESPAMIGQTVTLAATPEEALQLAWAASTGYLRLVPLAVGDRVPMPSAKPIDLGRPAIDWIDKAEPKDDDTPPPPLPPLPPLPAVPEAKAEPKEEAPEPPREKHKMKIRSGESDTHMLPIPNGEIDPIAVFIKDDEGNWKAGRITQSADDLDVTSRRPGSQQAPQPPTAPAVSAAPDTRGAGQSSRIK
jgi:Flp pilus assembly protein CpaB